MHPLTPATPPRSHHPGSLSPPAGPQPIIFSPLHPQHCTPVSCLLPQSSIQHPRHLLNTPIHPYSPNSTPSNYHYLLPIPLFHTHPPCPLTSPLPYPAPFYPTQHPFPYISTPPLTQISRILPSTIVQYPSPLPLPITPFS